MVYQNEMLDTLWISVTQSRGSALTSRTIRLLIVVSPESTSLLNACCGKVSSHDGTYGYSSTAAD